MKSRVALVSVLWGVTTLLSRLIGLVRDSVLGHVLGVTPAADAYTAAFRIPDWFSTLLAGGTLSVVFIPIFTAYLARNEEARASRSLSNVLNVLGVVLIVVGTGFWITTPWLVRRLAEGFDEEQLVLLTHLTRIVLPGQLFHILGALLSAALLARERHTVPAIAPLLYTVCVILGGLIGGSAEGFAWGVLAGAFLGPFLLPLIVNLRAGVRWSPVLDLRDPDLRITGVRFVAVMLGGSMLVLDDTWLTHYGSTMAGGSVALLGYAKTLMKAPMGIFGSAVGFATYPALTRLANDGKLGELYTTSTSATRRVLVLAMLSQVGVSVAAPEIGTLVYGTGRIAPERMGELGRCLVVFAAALGPWSAQILLSRAFYAQGKGWVPARLGLLILLLFAPLYGWLGAAFGPPGLAAASSLAVTVSVVALQVALRRQTGGTTGYGDLLGKLVGVTGTSIGLTLLVRGVLPDPTWTRADAAWRLLVLGGIGGSLFLALGFLVHLPELREALEPLLRRLRRRRGPPTG